MNNVVEEVKRIILESNPLLEAFGNAKTLRNNNSSRFGKYFEINFSKGGAPSGGKISNFLLEKSRVVGPGVGERNFHIFYLMTKSATAEDKEQLGIMDPKYFHYLNVSGEYHADGIDDVAEYQAVKQAMNVCQISDADRLAVFQIVAGILHLGNIAFVEEGNDAKVADPQALAFPAYLLGVSEELLQAKLTSRIMTTGGFGKRSSSYNVPMNLEQAQGTRDALAKALYSRTFDWIVQAVNSAMASLAAGLRNTSTLCLGVLDIFGFEIFEKNGFEQFCINYVNERLQQIFIELTLKSEQEEYQAEGIQWTPIDYFNNKVVVDLIESKRPPGLMAVLDDVCFTMHAQSEGADEKFVQKADSACGNNKHYQGLQTQFIVHHYAGSVTYDCQGFTESNKDTLFKDLVQLMQSTTNPFIRALFPEEIDDSDRKRPTTVSHKIKNQSQDLVETLMRCTPSYVRCIKPNESKKPKDWDFKRVEHQVRYLNLKENIRVRRAGFCYRNTFEKFLRRFAILTKETWPAWHGDPHQGIKIIMQSVDMDSKEWQMGRTKIFVKSPESLFLLEEQRDRKFHGYAKVIQRAYRRWKSRKYFLELRKKAADVVYGKKERKRFSLNREFLGDYLNYLDNPVLKALVGKNEKVSFAAQVTKYDRKFKPTQRELLITETAVILVGAEKEKNGPNKGKLVKAIKRKLQFSEIQSVSLSTKADDFFVLHIPSEFDNVFECIFKTELITVLSEKYLAATSRQLTVNFVDSIKYSVKKTTWQSGGTLALNFITDANARMPQVKNSGKATEVRVAAGLPKDSRPNAGSFVQSNRGAGAGRTGGISNGVQNRAFNQAPVHQGVAAQAAAFRPPGPAAVPVGSTSPAAKKRPPPPPPAKKMPQCRALYVRALMLLFGTDLFPKYHMQDYEASEADELSFKAGDIIAIVSKEDEGWWTGTVKGRKGLFPANYTEPA
ncbi:Unconventional myosin-Ie [Rhizophlyctis rosea]|nr:Unconventional myosin-Ie [Rhizophlyctis rosea]